MLSHKEKNITLSLKNILNYEVVEKSLLANNNFFLNNFKFFKLF